MELSDRDLLLRIGEKDQKAFYLFYQRYARLLQMWALKRTQNKEVTDDIVQNFWILIWTEPSIISTNDDRPVKDYLLRCFTHRMLNYLNSSYARALGNDTKINDVEDSLSYTHIIEELEIEDIKNLIDEVISSLPAMTQEIFTLLWDNNCSVKDAAQQLNISEKVVRTKYNKALSALRTQIKNMQNKDETLRSTETFISLLLLLNMLP